MKSKLLFSVSLLIFLFSCSKNIQNNENSIKQIPLYSYSDWYPDGGDISDSLLMPIIVDAFINESNLPWPGFFKGLEITNDGMVLKSVQYLNKMIFCNVEGIKDFLVPYNNNYFYYNNGNLELINDSLTT